MNQVTLEEMKHFCRRARCVSKLKISKPPKPVGPKTLKRRLPENVRKAIIVLTYGSDANFTKMVMGPTRVAKIFSISHKTVHSVVRYFRQQN